MLVVRVMNTRSVHSCIKLCISSTTRSYVHVRQCLLPGNLESSGSLLPKPARAFTKMLKESMPFSAISTHKSNMTDLRNNRLLRLKCYSDIFCH